MAKSKYKLSRSNVKKAISVCDPTYRALAMNLKVTHLTVKAFLWDKKNSSLLELFKIKQLDLETLANANVSDAIADGDEQMTRWWKEYMFKQRVHDEGTKMNIDGALDIKIIIEDLSKSKD